MTVFKTRPRFALLGPALALFALSACDSSSDDTDGAADEVEVRDSGSDSEEDASEDEEEDAATDDDDVDGGVEEDAGSDAGTDASVPAAKITIARASAVGHDRCYGVTYATDGKIVAVGQVSSGIEATADFSVLVARFLPTGEPDKTFGNDGFATKNVSVGGQVAGENGENARGVVILPDGKIVVAGQAEHDPAAAGVLARDMDVVLVKFNANGSVDETWGTKGVVRHDLNAGTITTNAMTSVQSLSAADTVWSLGLSGDKFVVHGAQRAVGNKTDGTPRTDTDWALLRLNADGALDTTFNTTGKVTLDIGEVGGSARAATVLADGSIIAAGYATTTGLISSAGQSTQQPVLYKVTPTGAFDTTFATADKTTLPGVFYDLLVPETLRCEAYGAGLQGDKLVTIGYGPTKGTGTGTDIIYGRFTSDGRVDESFGSQGTVYQDPGGYGDNGRYLLVLPDNRLLGLGGGRATPATPPAMGVNPPVDAFVGVLNADGTPSDFFGKDAKGMKLYDFNGGTNDFFWAASLSPDKKNVAIVGIASAASTSNDDDAALLILPLD